MAEDNKFGKFIGAVVGGWIMGALRSKESPIPRKQVVGVQQKIHPLPYKTMISPYGGLIVDVDGYRISSIFDTYAFKESLELFPRWIDEYEIEIAQRFEEYVQNILKSSGPRKYSGLHAYSHIVRDFEETHKASKKAQVPLDLIILLTTEGHDAVEDDPEFRELYKKWEITLIDGHHQERQKLEEIIASTIVRKVDAIENELLSYIPPNVRGNLREDLRRYIGIAKRLISDMTRWTTRYPYAFSMGHQYGRDGAEQLSQTFRRMVAKDADGTSNMLEIGLIFEKEATLRGIVEAFSDDKTIVNGYRVGEELRKKYGGIRNYGVEMPLAVRVEKAANSIYPSHFSNSTFNRYSQEVLESSDERTKQLLKLAMVGRDARVETTLRLLKPTSNHYEERYEEVRAIKDDVEKEIANKRHSTFYDRITLNGVIKDWLLLDGGGSKYIEFLENHPQKGPEFRQKAYASARHLMEVFPRFVKFYDPKGKSKNGKPELLDDPSIYDPKKHRFFTLGGVKAIMELLPDYWENVAGYKRQLHQSKKGGAAGTFLTF